MHVISMAVHAIAHLLSWDNTSIMYENRSRHTQAREASISKITTRFPHHIHSSHSILCMYVGLYSVLLASVCCEQCPWVTVNRWTLVAVAIRPSAQAFNKKILQNFTFTNFRFLIFSNNLSPPIYHRISSFFQIKKYFSLILLMNYGIYINKYTKWKYRLALQSKQVDL